MRSNACFCFIIVNLFCVLTTLAEKIVYEHNFNLILNPSYTLCNQTNSENKIDVLIYVHSTPTNLKRRVTIRETWASRNLFPNTRLVFMLGKTDNQATNDLLDLEMDTYNDLVMGDFLDTYKNLTHKAVMSLKWISEFCNTTSWIIKVDDDVIVNTFAIMNHLNKMKKYKDYRKKTIICFGWEWAYVNRNKKSKWYVSQEEFSDKYYEKYCSGFFLLFTMDLVRGMYEVAKYVKFFWVDDYYMTGMLAKRVKATLEFHNGEIFQYPIAIEEKFYGLKHSITMAAHLEGNINKMVQIWNYLFKLNKMFLDSKVPEYVYDDNMYSFKMLHRKNQIVDFVFN